MEEVVMKHTCNKCNREFKNRTGLRNHEKWHKTLNEKPAFICKVCSKAFHFSTSLTQHMKFHPELGNSDDLLVHTYMIKNKKLESTTELDSKTTIENTVYSCDACGKLFKGKKSLKKHLATHGENFGKFTTSVEVLKPTEAEKRNSWKCSLCIKYYESEIMLKKHLEMIHWKKAGKVFPRLSTELDVQSSSSEKLFGQCDMFIDQKTKSVRFQCSLCPKSFSSKENRYRHFLIHTGKSKFDCLVCKRSFNRQISLIHHAQKCHASEAKTTYQAKPHSADKIRCHQCSKTFNNKIFLSRHIRLSHKIPKTDDVKTLGKKASDAMFACKICNTFFHQRSNYTRHRLLKHSSKQKRKKSKINKLAKLLKLESQKNVPDKTVKQMLVCHYCKQQYTHQNALSRHINKAHLAIGEDKFVDSVYKYKEKDGKWECLTCNKLYAGKVYVRRHIQNMHVDPSLLDEDTVKARTCSACGRFFSQKNNCMLHFKNVHSKPEKTSDRYNSEKICEMYERPYYQTKTERKKRELQKKNELCPVDEKMELKQAENVLSRLLEERKEITSAESKEVVSSGSKTDFIEHFSEESNQTLVVTDNTGDNMQPHDFYCDTRTASSQLQLYSNPLEQTTVNKMSKSQQHEMSQYLHFDDQPSLDDFEDVDFYWGADGSRQAGGWDLDEIPQNRIVSENPVNEFSIVPYRKTVLFTCTVCGVMFREKQKLLLHKRKFHCPQNKDYPSSKSCFGICSFRSLAGSSSASHTSELITVDSDFEDWNITEQDFSMDDSGNRSTALIRRRHEVYSDDSSDDFSSDWTVAAANHKASADLMCRNCRKMFTCNGDLLIHERQHKVSLGKYLTHRRKHSNSYSFFT